MSLMTWSQIPGSVVGQAVDEATQSLTFPGLDRQLEVRLVQTVAILALLLVARRIAMMVIDRRVEDRTLRYKWGKATGYLAFFLGTVGVLQIWVEAVRSLGTFFGLLTAGLAIALKDLVADLAGWAFILWRRPFDLGDRIQLGEHAGDVVDIRIFAFTIMEIGNWVGADQSTGRMIHLPNSQVFSSPLANYTAQFPFLWNELAVLVTFESDWRRAKEILSDIAMQATAEVSEEAEQTLRQTMRLPIHYRKLTPVVYTSVQDSGVMLTIRYLCRPRAKRGTAEAMWEAILDAFHEHDDIDLAYPTQRLYLNPVEGKVGARAELPPLPPPGSAR